MDIWVLKAQQWVNATYAFRSGYVSCAETGMTSWAVMHSLTRGLQTELGITTLSDTFGAGTTSAVNLIGGISKSTTNKNLRIIVEAALYCKGYSGGAMDGSWGTSTQAGIASLLDDMGVPSATPADNKLTAKHLKALLTMDAFTLVSGGRSSVQAVQRWMNHNWFSRRDYDLVPCDGLYSRNVQKGLVYAIQYSLGMADGTANGNFGPATKDGLRTKANLGLNSMDSSSAPFVSLFKGALIFNGYTADWGSTSYTATTELSVREFQNFCKLETTGQADFATWASLLVSTGDPTRTATAADCKTPLNDARAQAIYDGGYRYIGRYITGGTQKRLSQSELALILNKGMSVVPIYQEYNNKVSYFTVDEGLRQGRAAHDNALALGLPSGTFIYFPVDFDAVEDEVRSAVVPYFRGVWTSLNEGGKYLPGVYGARNTCQIVSDSGYAKRSFVCGMSTGFSGNLGFPLPDNWAFDQIATKTLAEGQAGEIEIDHDVFGGRDEGVRSLDIALDPLDAYLTLTRFIEARAEAWRNLPAGNSDLGDIGHHLESVPYLVAEYLGAKYQASDFFGAVQASIVFGDFAPVWRDYVDSADGKPDSGQDLLKCPLTGRFTDMPHFGAALMGMLSHGEVETGTTPNLGDFAGWAGDLLTVATTAWNDGVSDADAYEWARTGILEPNSDFSYQDLQADVDAYLIGNAIHQDPSSTISDLTAYWYRDRDWAYARFQQFIARRFGSTAKMVEAFEQWLCAVDDGPILENLVSTGLQAREALWTVKTNEIMAVSRVQRPEFFTAIASGAARGILEKVIAVEPMPNPVTVNS